MFLILEKGVEVASGLGGGIVRLLWWWDDVCT